MNSLKAVLLCISLLSPAKAMSDIVDWMTLSDRLFGISPEFVFVIRETHDNLGRYGYGLRDTFLIARNISTGVDDHIWPISRFYDPSETKTNLAPISMPLQNAVSPYEILAQMGGIPITEEFQHSANGAMPEVSGALSWPISASVQNTLGYLQPYPVIEGIPAEQHNPMELLLGFVPYIKTCKTTGLLSLQYPFSSPNLTVLHRIDCFEAGRIVLSYIAIKH